MGYNCTKVNPNIQTETILNTEKTKNTTINVTMGIGIFWCDIRKYQSPLVIGIFS